MIINRKIVFFFILMSKKKERKKEIFMSNISLYLYHNYSINLVIFFVNGIKRFSFKKKD